MEIVAALKYPLNGRDWKGKLFLGSLFLLIPIFGQIVWLGYGIKVIQEVSAGNEEELPSWSNSGEYLGKGLVAFIALLVYFFPASIFGFLASAIFAVSDNVVSSFSTASSLFSLLLFLLTFSLAVASTFLFTIAIIRYSVTEQVSSFIDVVTSISLFLRNVPLVVVTYFVLTLGYFAVFAIVGILSVGFVTICLAFVVYAYYFLFVGHSLGRLALKLDLSPPQEQIFIQAPPTSQPASPPQPPNLLIQESAMSSNPEPPSFSNYAPTFQQALAQATVYEVRLPKSTPFEPERAHSLIRQILTQFPQITFVIIGEHNRIVWQIWDLHLEASYDLIPRAVQDIYPAAEVQTLPYQSPKVSSSFWRYLMLYGQFSHFVAPMKYVSELKELDPLSALVQPFGDLKEGDRIVHILHIASVISEKQVKDARNAITKSTIHPLQFLSAEGWGNALADVALGQTRSSKFVPESQKVYEQRLRDELLFNVFLLTQIDVVDRDDIQRLLSIQASVLQFHAENGLFFEDKMSGSNAFQVHDAVFERSSSAIGLLSSFQAGTDSRVSKARAVLSTQEIAGLWHLPHEGFATPEIAWLSGSKAPKEMLGNKEGIDIGDNIIGGLPHPIRIHPKDRTTHMNIVGKTGVGKSTFLHNLIHQDIQNGHGVAVVDPHGELVNHILRTSIPYERFDDVVLLDIANLEYPPPLNPLLAPGHDEGYTASEVVAILDKIEQIPIRVADSITAAFITLRHENTPTVRDVVRLFEDNQYRYRFINQVGDIVTQEFWQRFEQLSPGRQDERADPVIHRMRRFYRNPILHPMMCHPDALDFQDLMRRKKIILISLGIDERKVPGLERTLVGVVVVSQIQMAAMSSLDNPAPFHLYIDEVQNFVTAPLDRVFEEARKYRLQLTVANQYLGQLSAKVLDSIMGTVGATCVFQVGQKDARSLAPYFKPEFETDDLVNMDKFNAAVKTRFLGNTLPAFSIATRPDPGSINHVSSLAREATIRQRSINNYTPRTKDQVLDWLNKRYPRRSFTSPNQQAPGQQDVDWVVGDDREGNGKQAPSA